MLGIVLLPLLPRPRVFGEAVPAVESVVPVVALLSGVTFGAVCEFVVLGAWLASGVPVPVVVSPPAPELLAAWASGLASTSNATVAAVATSRPAVMMDVM